MASSEELASNLSSYKLQLRQVEAALTTQPDSDELLNLQQSLKEIIDITLELIAQSKVDSSSVAPVAKGSWRTGDQCIALWSEDGEFYNALIEDISDDHCTVKFTDLDVTDTTPLSTLQRPGAVPVKKSTKQADYQFEDIPSTSFTMQQRLATKTKQEQLKAQIEAKKKKKAKYNEKIKEIAEVREKEANKWKHFQNKAIKKSFGGVIKKSIFATSDEIQAKVGVGTCGISGKPMTKDLPTAVAKTTVVKKAALYTPRGDL